MWLGNFLWAFVSRRKGEEGPQTPCPAMKVSGSRPCIPYRLGRPSERPKPIDGPSRAISFEDPGRLDGRTRGRHSERRPTRVGLEACDGSFRRMDDFVGLGTAVRKASGTGAGATIAEITRLPRRRAECRLSIVSQEI
jgi:hypothetical protein